MSDGFVWPRDKALIERLARELALPPLSAASVEALGRYVALVASWNRKLDLTAARDPAAQVEVLLADALVLAATPAIVQANERLVDVGSGAGSPIVPLLLARSDLSASLVEPLRKRVAFLRTALGSLGLVERARVYEQKLDVAHPLVPDMPFDLAMSRATFAPEQWLPLGLQLATRTVVFLAAQSPPTMADARLVAQHDYRLPSSRAQRQLVCYAPAEA